MVVYLFECFTKTARSWSDSGPFSFYIRASGKTAADRYTRGEIAGL